ncbi:hypothetical protein J2W32_003755 [Variovorax boronicumulans]|uniref:Uncharacterized protein n=1 Tax=Variovorax boronicumulans TaxID=436515 RepID=A0AAW8D2N1_9BURK|nr:hypothetical protein [Variovorax boronicumulans]MDQ0038477.1 hypothetical protein [Variovorax boronicumulans]MDQ0044640.1 hypothetical protein [Variovorax boronicumulans]MDQ0054697.1 hypothetical protein [Variovorax boronicumulans]
MPDQECVEGLAQYERRFDLPMGYAGRGTYARGDRKLEITVRYLGIEVDDALELAEQNDA